MPRLSTIAPETADRETSGLYTQISEMFGGHVPNLMRTFANSPAVLQAWMGLAGTLASAFTPQVRFQIAIAVAQADHCEYCLSANTAAGRMTGVHDHDLEAARDGKASDPHVNALVELASAIVVLRGELSDTHLTTARTAGVTDEEIVQVIALVAMNTMMNYTNNVSQTDIDWPVVAIDRVAI